MHTYVYRNFNMNVYIQNINMLAIRNIICLFFGLLIWNLLVVFISVTN